MEGNLEAKQDILIRAATQIADDAWEELRGSILVQRQIGVTPRRLRDFSFGEARRRSELGESLLKRIAMIDSAELPHDLALTLRIVAFRARAWAQEAAWYWTVIDPLGTGMYGMFLPTAYCGGWFLNYVHAQLAAFSFEATEDDEHFLALVNDYGRVIEQFALRTAGQAERGIRMPKAQVRQARDLLTRFKKDLRHTLGVSPEQVATPRRRSFFSELDQAIRTRVEPAFDAALAGLSDSYLRLAPDAVGLRQYPGGTAVYEELVKLHTTLDLTPKQVHARGHARMIEVHNAMRSIRTDLRFEGDHAAFIASLNQDPRWRADTVEGIRGFFNRYLGRLQPRLRECFRETPKAEFGTAPLPEPLQGSMTFGYYESPREGHSFGQYLFNARNLAQQVLICLGSITYHELIPGHHLQFALQLENTTLHPLRRYSFATAYIEGWAEYAATLAEELGCYAEPEERYGRLMMDAFLTCRLVVDTGMNAMGWSLERARQYMRQHTGMTEAEISSDSVRYSCDIPGQALAYKLGDAKMLELREGMRRAEGDRFDLRDFHAAILEVGAIPMADLEWHIQRVIVERRIALEGLHC
jgi:uncharacterized protein (DUF885 family)